MSADKEIDVDILLCNKEKSADYDVVPVKDRIPIIQ